MRNSTLALTPAQPSLDDRVRMAQMMIASHFLPPAIKTVEQALTIMFMGEVLNLHPIVALNSINVIQGKPTVSPQLMIGLAQRSGQLEDLNISDDGETCTVIVKRRGMASAVTASFSIADSKTMGLIGKDNWLKQPKIMRQWRAVAAAFRLAFADVISGFYTPDEMGATVTIAEDGDMLIVDAQPLTAGAAEYSAPVEPPAAPAPADMVAANKRTIAAWFGETYPDHKANMGQIVKSILGTGYNWNADSAVEAARSSLTAYMATLADVPDEVDFSDEPPAPAAAPDRKQQELAAFTAQRAAIAFGIERGLTESETKKALGDHHNNGIGVFGDWTDPDTLERARTTLRSTARRPTAIEKGIAMKWSMGQLTAGVNLDDQLAALGETALMNYRWDAADATVNADRLVQDQRWQSHRSRPVTDATVNADRPVQVTDATVNADRPVQVLMIGIAAESAPALIAQVNGLFREGEVAVPDRTYLE